MTAEPSKDAEIGPSFTDIFPFTALASYSANVAPGRHAAMAGMSANAFHTVAGGLRRTKASSKRVQPWRDSSEAAVVATGAALASLFGTKAASGVAGATPCPALRAIGCAP